MSRSLAQATLTTYRLRQQLKAPYRLSFDTLFAFDTLIVAVSVEGQTGLGEITPLPGYSEETVDSALSVLDYVRRAVGKGVPFAALIDKLAPTAPMVASALACATETQAEGGGAFKDPVPTALSLAALCGGSTQVEVAERARELQHLGYKHLKLKVGGSDIAEDIERLRAVAVVCAEDVTISVDANQRLSYSEALALCEVAAEVQVLVVEQPFADDDWNNFESLAAVAPVPLMLDESIWDERDIDRAADVGTKWIKLKLCKHPGIAASHALIDRAHGHGMKVVFGNGVQGAIGNHLEARIFNAAALDTPGEFNGVLKVADDPFNGAFRVENGQLHAGGVPGVSEAVNAMKPMFSAMFTM